jgi:hypothetical protein
MVGPGSWKPVPLIPSPLSKLLGTVNSIICLKKFLPFLEMLERTKVTLGMPFQPSLIHFLYISSNISLGDWLALASYGWIMSRHFQLRCSATPGSPSILLEMHPPAITQIRRTQGFEKYSRVCDCGYDLRRFLIK